MQFLEQTLLNSLIFQISAQAMSNFNFDFSLNGGLSKGEQNKKQQLTKNTEAEKVPFASYPQGDSHSKSYKRKPKKDRPTIDQPQRKLIKTSSTPPDMKYESGTSHLQNGASGKDNSLNTKLKKEEDLKLQKVYNPKFLSDQGEDGLFEYIMMYSYSEKQKKLEAPEEDYTFLTKLQGTKLETRKSPQLQARQDLYMEKFTAYKSKNRIEQPFDDGYYELVRELHSNLPKEL